MGKEVKGLLERLQAGEEVICAEGYVFAFEQRGYLKAGAFVPEVVLEHGEMVRMLHEEFVHAGSDVVEAFTYYGHRAKLELIDREDDLERLNREALRIARQVADNTGTLMAGNICNSIVYKPTEEGEQAARAIFKEQIEWAVEGGADYIIAETFQAYGEAKVALECIKQYGKGLPAVVTICADSMTVDGLTAAEACRRLEEAGADVVGVNCFSGPDTILPIIRDIRKACKGPIACLPVPYRTDEKAKCMQDLVDSRTGKRSFPGDLNAWLCSRSHIKDFTNELRKIGVQYMGLCCGNQGHYTRAMAEALGRTPLASKYSPDMTQHLSEAKDEKYSYGYSSYHKAFSNPK